MKIRTALTLKNTGITAAIFLLCMVLVYIVSEQTRDRTFFRDLRSEGITKAHLFLENKEPLLFEIDHIINSLTEYRNAIAEGDSERLCSLLRDGRIAKEKVDG